MELVNLLQQRNKKIEEKKEELYELETGLIGAEVSFNGKTAIVMEVDWHHQQIFLNYDDVNMEWVSFQK